MTANRYAVLFALGLGSARACRIRWRAYGGTNPVPRTQFTTHGNILRAHTHRQWRSMFPERHRELGQVSLTQ